VAAGEVSGSDTIERGVREPGILPRHLPFSSRGRSRGACSWRNFAIPIAACVLSALSPPAPAQVADDPSTGELKRLTLDELMSVEVTSVTKEPQKLLRAPAAIEVITAEDIRRSGATTLPQALRLADNLQVAQINAHDWAISARGFNADLANKLLVLIDGRAVYTPLYGGVLWNVQDYLLEDIDRIEVISGPGGTVWGANAVNGVINIVTKAARETQGLYAYTAAGNQLEEQGGIRFGAQLAPDVYFRAYGKYTDEGAEITSTGADADDSWHIARGGLRLDRETGVDQFTVQGDGYSGHEAMAGIGHSDLSGVNVLGRWTHSGPDNTWTSLQAYYDHAYLTQPYPAVARSTFESGFPASLLTDALDTYDLDFQDHFHFGSRQKLAWGLGYRATREANYDLSQIRFAPPVLNQALYSAFVQDEIELASTLYLTAGSKLEHNDYTGSEIEPSVRLQWNVRPAELVWAAVSRAVRTPSRYDHDLYAPSGLGAPPPLQLPTLIVQNNPDFVSETLVAYEVGYRAELGSRLTGSLSTFYNDYHDLRSVTPTPTTLFYPYPYPVYFQNNLEADTYGFELTVSWQLLDWWRMRVGYNLLRENLRLRPGTIDATGGTNDTADPQQQFALHSRMNLPHNLSWDAALRWVDSFQIDHGPTAGPVVGIVPSYFGLDMRLAWQFSSRLEVSLVGQNLLHEYHVEYGFPSPTREQIVRSVFAKLTWGF
jgi:iron complex outermembrane recepter protein